MNETIIEAETDLGAVEDIKTEQAVATVGGQAVSIQSAAPIVSQIMDLASKEGVSPEMFDRLVAWQERERLRLAEEEFDDALQAMQSEIPQVSRLGIVDLNKKGAVYDPKNKYNFARLEEIDTVVRPIMDKYKFAVTYDRVQRSGEGGGLVVTGTLSRRGVKRTASFPLPLDTGFGRNNLQAAGSTDHYAKRYILEGFLNIVRKGKDDDGTTADPLLPDEIADIMELLSRTKTSIVGFLNTMVSNIDWGGDPEDQDYRPDPIMLLEQVQRGDFARMHRALSSKLHAMKKKAGDEA